jgi:hypothetical protein
MKLQGQIPAVTNVVIAISATLAGIMIALRFAPSTLGHENQGASSLSIAAIGVLTLIIVGLLFLKSMGERRYQIERELLEAFLDHIPDNVYFKNRNTGSAAHRFSVNCLSVNELSSSLRKRGSLYARWLRK